MPAFADITDNGRTLICAPLHSGVRKNMISRIDHVSLAVEDFAQAEKFFRSVLGAVPGSEGDDPGLKFFWKIFSLGDLSRLEIMKPTGKGSFLEGFLAKRGGGVHHITLQTPSIARAKESLTQKGIPYFGYKEHGDYWKELFIHPRDAFGVLIQIAEFRAPEWLNDSVNLKEGNKWLVEGEENAFRICVAHPGGGTAAVDLSREELTQLKEQLESALQRTSPSRSSSPAQ